MKKPRAFVHNMAAVIPSIILTAAPLMAGYPLGLIVSIPVGALAWWVAVKYWAK